MLGPTERLFPGRTWRWGCCPLLHVWLYNLLVGHMAWPVTKAQGPMADTPRSHGCDRAHEAVHVVEETLCTAVAAGKLGTLAAALTKTKLADALNGNGPFTGFAPTDEALTTAWEALGVTAEELLGREELGRHGEVPCQPCC